MFTGIVEENSKILQVVVGDRSLQIVVSRPKQFDDLSIGDSVACNGVCLTVESFDDETIKFTIGYETLNITDWSPESLQGKTLNLERSLRFGDRIHGHLVSGHVDTQSKIEKVEWVGDCLLLNLGMPKERAAEIWEKSSVALNGVSLTVNKVFDDQFQVCLVPETLRKTNLGNVQVGETMNLETDYYMKGLLNSQGAKDAQCT